MFLDSLSSVTQAAPDILDSFLTLLRPRQWHVLDGAVACIAVWTLLRWARTSRRRFRTTQLRGPPSDGFLYGVGERLHDAEDSGAIYEGWAQEYGAVYEVPSTLGRKRVVLCDPKALAHFYSKEMWTYIQIPFTKNLHANLFGKGMLWSHGESHRRQRKHLSPAFSIAAIRNLTPVFFDSAYKTKVAWDSLIASSEGDNAIIDVQIWMNHISLDTIGLAGFSHSFGALDGKHTDVAKAFDSIGGSPRSMVLNKYVFLLGLVFPSLANISTTRAKKLREITNAMHEISDALISRTQKELEMGVIGGKEEKSIIGLLIKGVNEDSEYQLTRDEIVAQMKLFLIAGYEATSSVMTWALLELSWNPDVQTRLRNELLEFGADPTYDDFVKGLPYLDAVVHEVLRMYAPSIEFTRLAVKDDVIPLSEPIRTRSGELVDSVMISKGTLICIPVRCMNRSVAMWGDDAKVFRPSRWLVDEHGNDGIPAKAKELPGHRHLLSFVDGARICPGRNFAITEFKVVFSVLVKNFVFELPGGVDSETQAVRGILPRPKPASKAGCELPLRVRPYVS